MACQGANVLPLLVYLVWRASLNYAVTHQRTNGRTNFLKYRFGGYLSRAIGVRDTFFGLSVWGIPFPGYRFGGYLSPAIGLVDTFLGLSVWGIPFSGCCKPFRVNIFVGQSPLKE